MHIFYKPTTNYYKANDTKVEEEKLIRKIKPAKLKIMKFDEYEIIKSRGDKIMRVFKMDDWICGVSDGLSLPCAICGKENIKWDYIIEDNIWEKIVPDEYKRDVVCLPCLEKLSKKANEPFAEYIEFVQYTGDGVTVEFIPSNVFYY